MSSIKYVGTVLHGFADVFSPLNDSLADSQGLASLLADFGWALDPDSDLAQITAAFASLPDAFSALDDAVKAFEDSSDDAQAADLAGDVGELASAIAAIVSAIQTLASATPRSAWPAPLNTAVFWQTFPLEILEYLIYLYLETFQGKIFAVLRLIGVIVEDYTVPTTLGRVPYVRRGVRWDRLVTAVTRPQDIPKEVYGWGGPLELHRLLDNVRILGLAFNRPAAVHDALPELLDTYYDQAAPSRQDAYELSIPVYWEINEIGSTLALILIEVAALPIPPVGDKTSPAVGLAVYPRITGEAGLSFQLTDSITLKIDAGFTSTAAIRVEIRPGDVRVFVDPSLSEPIEAAVTIDAKPTKPWIPLGDPDSSRLEVRHLHGKVEATGPVTDLEFIIEIALDDAALIIQFGEGDGFLQQILGDSPQTVSLGLGLTWSSKHGLQLSGQAKLEVTLPIHESIAGVIDIDSITLGLGANVSPAGVALSVAITGGLNIGPVQASVDRVGVQANLGFVLPGQPPGNLGAVNLGWAFLPPKGLGLAIDAGPVSGGGYISFDQDAGRYAGILQLTLPILSVTVIGLLDTKLPGGKQGFSFLLIVACDFPPIQLGYGFVLTGLGGLAGINRTVVAQALQDGVHSGSVNNILFPEDPLGHAAELITDLETIFPPTDGDYVFGPMAELGWGEPDPIITAELGIILTLPDPIVIVLLGKIEILLPDPDSPIVELRLQVAGSLDLTNKLLAIDTTLRDSRILAFSISGDTSFRLAFGAQPSFLFSMGGFNPHFQAPPNFRNLQRLSIALGQGENPRIAIETYLAITANTFQIGAKASIYVEYADFKVSGDMGFDALFHFQPFSFQIDVEADVSVNGLLGFSASVHLDVTLTGPDPFRCKGMAVVHCLGTHSIPIDIPFGQTATEKPVTPPDPWPQLQAEVGRTGNWSASLPGDSQRTAVLAQSQGTSGKTFVDPLGGLTLRQKIVPLDRTIDKFGEGRLAAPVQFGISQVSVGALIFSKTPTAGQSSLDPASGPFAAAQFEQMSDAEQLSRPSFEQMNSGVSIAGGALDFGAARGRDYAYETQVVDSSVVLTPYKPTAGAQLAAHLVGPSAKAPSQTTGMGKYAPPPSQPPAAQMARAGYLIADVATLADKTAVLTSASLPIPNPPEKGAMMRALKSYYAAVPADRGKYAVMGAWELT